MWAKPLGVLVQIPIEYPVFHGDMCIAVEYPPVMIRGTLGTLGGHDRAVYLAAIHLAVIPLCRTEPSARRTGDRTSKDKYPCRYISHIKDTVCSQYHWYADANGPHTPCGLKGPRLGEPFSTANHAKTRTATRFWRSQILGISPGNASKFEQVLDSNSNRIRTVFSPVRIRWHCLVE